MSIEPQNDITYLDKSLRPTVWGDYIGQASTKQNLQILINAARERGHPPEHLLFYGPPGLGKTTLAYLIAEEMGAQIKVTSGPAIEKVGDLASILTNLSPGDILFIDEVHRLNKLIEEVLYPAMESGSLNIILGKGPGARVIQLDLPPFTLVAATTRLALLSAPLRSRFSGGTFRLELYQPEEIAQIIKRSALLLNIELESEAARAIAERSRCTPRIANHLLKRCRDFAQVSKTTLTRESVNDCLTMLGLDNLGLSPADRLLLETLVDKFNGGPVGVGTLATALSEEEDTIEDVHEPYLIQLGLLERTPRGRVVTTHGYKHLGRL
ncbi:MAG: Holliday junction branch migration DNA helicase RuvB [Candidatus Vogelbacteria bacterium]|nr:Holliday junction branch migration DNA helicase RuvB [Candidatus Vogelbacteria bacterium]